MTSPGENPVPCDWDAGLLLATETLGLAAGWDAEGKGLRRYLTSYAAAALSLDSAPVSTTRPSTRDPLHRQAFC